MDRQRKSSVQKGFRQVDRCPYTGHRTVGKIIREQVPNYMEQSLS